MADRIHPLNLPCMPNGDSEAEFWLTSFATRLAEQRESLAIPREVADNIAALADAFHEAYFIAKSPDSNTKRNIELKTLARNAAVLAVREVINEIKARPDVTAVQILTGDDNLKDTDRLVVDPAFQQHLY